MHTGLPVSAMILVKTTVNAPVYLKMDEDPLYFNAHWEITIQRIHRITVICSKSQLKYGDIYRKKCELVLF